MDPMDVDINSYAMWYDQPGFQMDAATLEGLYTDLGAMQPAALLSAVSGSDDTRLVFILLDDTGLVHAVHRVRQYTRQLEQGGMEAGDLVPTAILNETRDLGPTFIRFPADGFRRTEVLRRVVALEEVNAMAVELADEGQLPVVQNQQEARNVRTRAMMLVPPEAAGPLIALVSRPGGLNPRELWEVIASPLYEDEDRRNAVLPFLEWCCVAFTYGVGVDNPLHLPRPQRLELSPFLDIRRTEMYRRDLPARFPAAQRAGQNLEPMVQMLGGYRDDLREREAALAAREEARVLEWQAERDARDADRVAAAATVPSKRWPNSWPVLTTLCGVATEAELPPLWLEMAKTNTKSDRATIQHQLDGLADPRLGPAIGEGVEPICTGELAKDLGQLRFKTGINNLDVGLSIFMVSHPDAEHNASVAAAAGLYDQQMLGVGNLTLPEVLKLKEAMAFRLPTSFIQVEHVCWCYQRLLAVTLGIEHPVIEAFGLFIDRLAAMRLRLLKDFDGDVGRCAGLLRSVHIKMFKWLDPTIRGKQTPLPNFVQITEMIDEDQWTVPRMPANFLTTLSGAPKPAAAPAAEAGGDHRVVAPLEHLDRTRIPNIYNFKVAEYMAKNGRPPKNEKGREMCLRYHVKGECVKNCRRKTDHVKHSSGDTDKLVKYLESGKAL